MRSSRSIPCVLVVLLGSASSAQVTQRVSVNSGGAQGNNPSLIASISADGRYVAFGSYASNLVSGDTNGAQDVFVRDRMLGTTERVSISTTNGQGNSISLVPSISADGRYVAFQSNASNLVIGDSNGDSDVFVRDRLLGTTQWVSVGSGGGGANGASFYASISADGRYVAFASGASNLAPNDTNFTADILVRDLQLGTTECVSVDSGGAQANGESKSHAISADGRYVAFVSTATNLVGGDTNGKADVFVRDRQLGTTERVSVDSGGVEGNDDSPTIGGYYRFSISADGRYVAFESAANNLVAGDTNGSPDIFVRDRQLGTTERASIDSSSVQGNVGSFLPSMSSDGRFVTFASSATNLVTGDTNGLWDIFVHDRQTGTTDRVSVDSGGVQANGTTFTNSAYAWVSADGRYVAFYSYASNLVIGDTNANPDVFVRDRFGGTNFTSLCDPGIAGVIACPCVNPPSGLGRGCDNSSSTGGAVLSASGGTYLSSDSLVFTTSGERPTALSIVTQWIGSNATGAVFGQGVRCTSGTFKRLYTKSAVGGSITAPNFGAGDLQVSVRSAALGDVLAAGQSRWHFVFYRDPNVLGGCPATSTFNATQTGVVTWSP